MRRMSDKNQNLLYCDIIDRLIIQRALKLIEGYYKVYYVS
jgi:hypothetical protein